MAIHYYQSDDPTDPLRRKVRPTFGETEAEIAEKVLAEIREASEESGPDPAHQEEHDG